MLMHVNAISSEHCGHIDDASCNAIKAINQNVLTLNEKMDLMLAHFNLTSPNHTFPIIVSSATIIAPPSFWLSYVLFIIVLGYLFIA
jgi:hypothetical protein